jgi:hypothetical protein
MSATTPELLPEPCSPPLRAADHHLPELVLLPVPVSEPPYDDELPSPTGARLSLVTTQPAPLGPLAHLPALRLVSPPAPTALPAAPAPAVRPVARALVQGLLEVLGGVRPATQLRRRTSLELYADVEELVREQPRPVGTRPPTGAVLSLHVQQPTSGVAEVSATVRRGRRAAALALRLELRTGAWCCTAVSGLGPDLPRERAEPVDGEA